MLPAVNKSHISLTLVKLINRTTAKKTRISTTLLAYIHPPPALKKIGEGIFFLEGGGQMYTGYKPG